jgi:glycosyltransferase involved in cell wall biosynthesis
MAIRVRDPNTNRAGRRIAILTNILQPYRVAVFRELRRRCDDLLVFVSTPLRERPNACAARDGLNVVQQRSLRWRETERHAHGFEQTLDIQFPYDTITQLRRFGPDVIVCSELGLRTLQASVYRRLARAKRLVVWAAVSEISEQARGCVRSVLRRGLLSLADAVIVNGESGARYVEGFGAKTERVFRVPPTNEVAEFLSLPSVRSEHIRRRLVYCGQLIERKGLIPFLSHLVDWANAHSKEEIDFWVAGDGPLREMIASYPVPANLSMRVLGHVSYNRLPEIYRQGGILGFPTLADEWGMVVGEAMASGLPVLGSLYSDAVAELVVDGQTGWTFRPDQTEEVKSAIDRAFSAPIERLDRMGRDARQRVASMTPAMMAEQIIAAVEFSCNS